MSAAHHLIPRGSARRRPRLPGRVTVLLTLLAAGCYLTVGVGLGQAGADVGELGAPPVELEVKQALVDFYSAGHPPDSTVDIQFDGPIQVGRPTEHANPPPEPWCVRCGYPDQGISLMYPVAATVSVSVRQELGSSALAALPPVGRTTTYNGTSCPGITLAQYCPTYYFYRDGQGNWQIA